jgi:hypothetical protein
MVKFRESAIIAEIRNKQLGIIIPWRQIGRE